MGKFIRPKPENDTPPVWFLTYADLMNLVLAFFVAIVSYSTVSAHKYQDAAQSFRGAFHAFTSMGASAGVATSGAAHPSESLEKAARALQQRFQVIGHGQDIRTDYEVDGGLRITIPHSLLFKDSSAMLLPETHTLLRSIAEVLGQLPENAIEVAGHTDNQQIPPNAKYRDNLELSYQRADIVMRRLAEYGKLPLIRFTVGGCGEGKPIATNETEAGRQTNCRIEICVRADRESSKIPTVRKDMERKLKPVGGTVVPLSR